MRNALNESAPERGLKPATTSAPKRITELVVAGFSPRLLGSHILSVMESRGVAPKAEVDPCFCAGYESPHKVRKRFGNRNSNRHPCEGLREESPATATRR